VECTVETLGSGGACRRASVMIFFTLTHATNFDCYFESGEAA
jgi:hypothetical protein